MLREWLKTRLNARGVIRKMVEIGLFCFKCGQSEESKVHTEKRLGSHEFVECVSYESWQEAIQE